MEAGLSQNRKAIVKEGVRILRPDEYELLCRGAKINTVMGETNIAHLDGLLLTGLRYIEAQRFQKNPSWFDPRGFVFLPEGAVLKVKRTQTERWVKLNERGRGAMPLFLQSRKLPSTQAWGESMKRWAENAGLNPEHLCAKTLRKTWESWLVFCYPERLPQILLNQGHTAITSIAHYLNMPFLPEDREAMRPYVEGMF